jgi:hypothetical protein
MVVEQTVDIPASRRLLIDVPPEVPEGRTILAFTPVGKADDGKAVSPSLEAFRLEAERKAGRRFADPSGDSLQKFCGSLTRIYTEDGVDTKRRMRDEWER